MNLKKIGEILDKLNRVSLNDAITNHEEILRRNFQHFMNNLTAEEIGFSKIPKFPPQNWFYYPIAETEVFTLAIFAIPSGMRLPFHDHPAMTVLCKPFLGEYKQFQVNRASLTIHGVQTIRANDDCHIVTSDSIHAIEAVTDSAFIDLVMPPYSEFRDQGRAISYFEEIDHGVIRRCNVPASNKSVRFDTFYYDRCLAKLRLF